MLRVQGSGLGCSGLGVRVDGRGSRVKGGLAVVGVDVDETPLDLFSIQRSAFSV